MCGVFGLFADQAGGFEPRFISRSLEKLAYLSESRGKDSSGLFFRNEADRTLNILKGDVSISYLLKQPGIRRLIKMTTGTRLKGNERRITETFAAMGHARLVTNGSQLQDVNNQPVVKDGIIGIHNGIIINETELWSRYPSLQRMYEIDTEILLDLVGMRIREGWEMAAAVSCSVREIFGTVSAVLYCAAVDQFALATNNGSLYVLTDNEKFMAFASEKYFLTEYARSMLSKDAAAGLALKQVGPGTGYIVRVSPFQIRAFSMDDPEKRRSENDQPVAVFRTEIESVSDGKIRGEVVLDVARLATKPQASSEASLLEYPLDRIRALKRCSKCLLPETFPFIVYDERGVCNYCHNYKLKNQPKPIDELFALVDSYRSRNGEPDCIVPYSGGRDSSYTLHIVKNVLKLNPIAFTYDWGMVTDLGRRNIARVCGKLGVENILISADIRRKRENIRRNILAWLRRPHLGMIPLFMAGDKYFFYYTNQIKKQTGIRLNIWGINPMENTDFKVGFMGIAPDFEKERIYSLSKSRQVRLIGGILSNITRNPAYINRSVGDTIGSFASRYLGTRRDYYHMFDYYRWDEEEIEKLLLSEYLWETAIDTKTTWRIGDGTAAFYNYIYCTVSGFSEYDTFRSNQIREGMLSREEGLRLIEEENRPRYASIKWYSEIIGIDFSTIIKRVNSIPKLYR